MDKIQSAFKKLNQREKTLVLVAFAFVSTFLLKTLAIDEALKIQEVLAASERASFEIQKKEAMLSDLRQSKRSSLRDSPLWKYRKENVGVSSLVQAISDHEKEMQDFNIRKIASDKFDRTPDFDKTTFQMEIEAPFNSVGGFLEYLEKSKLLTRVEAVKVFRIDKDLRLCRALIQVQSFSWREL